MCPEDITTSTSVGISSTEVTFSMRISDNVDGNPAFSCTPASGSSFPFGETTVTCMVEDESGNMDNCTFVIDVRGECV